MEIYFKLEKLKNKMIKPATTQRLNSFFDGAINRLSDDQKINLIELIKQHTKDVVTFLEKSLSNNKQ